jgi:hypothetical protein
MLGEGNPFARHPLRRYAFGWEQLAARSGRHLDLGCGRGGGQPRRLLERLVYVDGVIFKSANFF